MPRYLNALVESVPCLNFFTLFIPALIEDSEGEPAAQLSYNFVSKVTRCMVGVPDAYGLTSGTAVYLKHLRRKKESDGLHLFRPDVVRVDCVSFVIGLEDAGVWEQLVRCRIRRLEMEFLSTSFISEGLPLGLEELVVKQLRLTDGCTEDLERIVGEFFEGGGKFSFDVVLDQLDEHSGELDEDDDWIAELDFWTRTLGRRPDVVAGGFWDSFLYHVLLFVTKFSSTL
jgi:hypothetical protein